MTGLVQAREMGEWGKTQQTKYLKTRRKIRLNYPCLIVLAIEHFPLQPANGMSIELSLQKGQTRLRTSPWTIFRYHKVSKPIHLHAVRRPRRLLGSYLISISVNSVLSYPPRYDYSVAALPHNPVGARPAEDIADLAASNCSRPLRRRITYFDFAFAVYSLVLR